MLIRAVTLEGHPALGDLHLDFTDDESNPFNVVVLAGENGTGKSAILEAIQLTFEQQVQRGIGVVTLDITLAPGETATLRNAIGPSELAEPAGHYSLRFDSSPSPSLWENAYSLSWQDRLGRAYNAPLPWGNGEVMLLMRSYLSEAAIAAGSASIGKITALQLDPQDGKSARFGRTDGHQIEQVLVDVLDADAHGLRQWVLQHPGTAPPPEVVDHGFRRFLRAFETMFPDKRFKELRRDGEQLQLVFEEFGRESTLGTLSSGEKQIVFRGGELLRNRGSVGGSIVLFDEPELSLHPDWQGRVVDFLKQALLQADGTHPQLILATHSPFIVHGAAGSKVVILRKDRTTGVVSEDPNPQYPAAYGMAAVRAFNLDAFLADAKHHTILFVEGGSDVQILQHAWRALRGGSPPFDIRDAHGASNIAVTLNHLETSGTRGRRVIGLFDFDDAFNRWKSVWNNDGQQAGDERTGLRRTKAGLDGAALLLPVPAHRSLLAGEALGSASVVSLELLFEDDALPLEMVGLRRVPGGGSIPYFRDKHKTEFAALTAAFDKKRFVHFEPLIASLEALA